MRRHTKIGYAFNRIINIQVTVKENTSNLRAATNINKLTSITDIGNF